MNYRTFSAEGNRAEEMASDRLTLLNPDHTEGKLYNHQEKLGLGGSGGLGNYKR